MKSLGNANFTMPSEWFKHYQAENVAKGQLILPSLCTFLGNLSLGHDQ